MQINEVMDFLETDKLSATFSSQGLKYLSLRNHNGELTVDLKNYPKESEPPDPRAGLLIGETIKFLKTGNHDMKLDLSEFTAFQQSVFHEVSKINAGNICTYKDLAVRLGKPGAAQAVGNAVSKNPVSYFLPTHRVLPQKGLIICRSGAGFLREKLLQHEGQNIEELRSNYVCQRKCTVD